MRNRLLQTGEFICIQNMCQGTCQFPCQRNMLQHMGINDCQIIIDMSRQYLALRKILYDLPVTFIDSRLALTVCDDINIEYRFLTIRQMIVILKIKLNRLRQLSDLSGIQRCHKCLIEARDLKIMFDCKLIPRMHLVSELLSLDPVSA